MTGRNERCQCGSGKKFKKCHGAPTAAQPRKQATVHPQIDFQRMRVQHEAQEAQRQAQQGLGRPIISAMFNGHRFVAVGSALYNSPHWKTFHDFLLSYIVRVFGREWGSNQLNKTDDQQHPLVKWYRAARSYQKQSTKDGQEIQTAPMTGAIREYLGLAYNLYLLAHNAELQQKLVDRLKNEQNFTGACYETYVAASFIAAGFTLALENEADVQRKHCEFTATYTPTGANYSVEAKARQPGKATAAIRNQLYEALKKDASHERIIFVDLNLPDGGDAETAKRLLEEALTSVDNSQDTLRIQNQLCPSAYVIVTNRPYAYTLDATGGQMTFATTGFRIADYFPKTGFPDIREARLARERHKPLHDLLVSMNRHREIPVTFDGEAAEFAFGTNIPRLIIGNRYIIPVLGETDAVGTLEQGMISESSKQALGVYRLDDGRQIIASTPITDEELAVWRRHPETFFGVRIPQSSKIEDPLELFDWFYGVYRNTQKERLRQLASDMGIGMNPPMSDEDLLIEYCERLTTSMVVRRTMTEQSK